jgi:signal peptide peptidase SppA
MNAQLHSECAGRVWTMYREPLLAMLRAVRSDAPLHPHAAAQGGTLARAGTVAVIPIRGMIMPGDSFMLDFFGGTSVEKFRRNFREALADESVSAILLKIESPGGMVDMVASMADEIFSARGRKPIVAYTETMAASAAYWLGTQADQFMAARDAIVGSIGVYLEHVSLEKALEQQGIEVTLISAGEHKTDGHPYSALPDDVRAEMQKRINEVNADFRGAVARGRGVTPAVVDENFGQGLMFSAKDAARLGMLDKVATIDAVVSSMVNGRRRGMAADADALSIVATADVVEPPVIVLTDPPDLPSEPVADGIVATAEDLAALQLEADADALAATMAMLERL